MDETITEDQAVAELRQAMAAVRAQATPPGMRIVPAQYPTARKPVPKADWDKLSDTLKNRTPYYEPAPAAIPQISFASNVGKTPPVPSPPADPVEFPIDLVVTWVDGSDPAWQAVRRAYIKGDGGSRFTNAGELTFLLRSVRRFAPWIRTVHIVTADQQPKLEPLGLDVRIVSHRQILDGKYLPTFCSSTIEAGIHNIPGLAEHFLFANDDTMFGAPVEPGHFFTRDGRAILTFGGDMRKHGGVGRMRNNAADALDEMFGVRRWRNTWHHIAPCRRSALAELAGRIPDKFDLWMSQKTRTAQSVALNNALWSEYMLNAGYGVEVEPSRKLRAAYIRADDLGDRRRANRIIESMPHLICINHSTSANAANVRAFGEAYWPLQPQWAKLRSSGDAIMTGCDESQAEFLEAWYAHVRQHSNLPIIFADKGMSARTRAWCAERGEVISVRGHFDHPYLRKPLALIQSSYARTLWLDPDCWIMADISPIFAAIGDSDLAVSRDIPRCDKYQAGVIAYRHGSPGFIEWATLCIAGFATGIPRVRHTGDQAIMCYLIERGRLRHRTLGYECNNLNRLPNPPRIEDTIIRHYSGNKRHLRAAIAEWRSTVT